uniref:Uncharacterized protein n=1 Tax=Knipowitschia caucasica TaxID=637954 RepID=A0AAV2IY12_KNICA
MRPSAIGRHAASPPLFSERACRALIVPTEMRMPLHMEAHIKNPRPNSLELRPVPSCQLPEGRPPVRAGQQGAGRLIDGGGAGVKVNERNKELYW